MAEEPWQKALNNLEKANKWATRAVICRMLGRLEGYELKNLDWFVKICEQEVNLCEPKA